jgi:type I restriction enzyme S subunit
VEWLGEVPAHWALNKLGRAALCLDGQRVPLNSEDRSFRSGDVPYWGANSVVDYVDEALFNEELVLLGEDGAPFFDSLRPVSFYVNGPIWPNNHVHVLRCQPSLNPKFAVHALNSTDYTNFIDGSTRDKLTQGEMRRIPLPMPSPDEQAQIVTFLDREMAKTDALVAAQQRLIELLKEKRQAVISHAVTKGLNPDAPVKDSGVEWLGEVPAHWEVKSLNRITTEKRDGPFGSGLKSEHYTDSGVRVVRLQNIRRNGFDGSDAAYIDEGYFSAELARHGVCQGDILIAGLGDERNTVGRACVAPGEIEPAMVKADCFRFRLDAQQSLPEFVAAQLNAGADADAGFLATGSTRSRIPLSSMALRKLALPPLPEQRAIAAFLDRETAKIDALVVEAETAVVLFQERRAALISAAVTGQIDVRGVAEAEAA